MPRISVPYPLPSERGGQDLWVQSAGGGRCHLVVRDRGGNTREENSWTARSGELIEQRAIIIQVACTVGAVGFYAYHSPVFVWQIRGHLPARLPNDREAVACAYCAAIARAR
jgi:hypothetical protein